MSKQSNKRRINLPHYNPTPTPRQIVQYSLTYPGLPTLAERMTANRKRRQPAAALRINVPDDIMLAANLTMGHRDPPPDYSIVARKPVVDIIDGCNLADGVLGVVEVQPEIVQKVTVQEIPQVVEPPKNDKKFISLLASIPKQQKS